MGNGWKRDDEEAANKAVKDSEKEAEETMKTAKKKEHDDDKDKDKTDNKSLGKRITLLEEVVGIRVV